MDEQRQDDQLGSAYNSFVPRKQWTIEKSGERGSGRYVLMARYDDDDVCFVYKLVGWLVGFLWHISLCRLFNVKSIFIHINASISNNSV